MTEWLAWARGPVFRACFLIMVLGLVRVVLLSAANVLRILLADREQGRRVPWAEVGRATLKWMVPFRAGLGQRPVFSVTSMLFHICIIVTPVFLAAHILLWKRGLGVSWPAIGHWTADGLTITAVVAGIALLLQRIGSRPSRAISRGQDFALPLLILVPMVSGYLGTHPWLNPFDYNGTMFVHVMSANLLFLAVPFSKISHVALFPATQLVSQLGWHLAPGAGAKVAAALGKEDEPI